jgi:hypothetical protein
MDVDKYPLPPRWIVYLVEDPKHPFYQIFRGLFMDQLPEDDDPKCAYRGDNYSLACEIKRSKNTELERMRNKQTLDLNL